MRKAAAFLRFSEHSLGYLVSGGKIPAVRLGGRVLYRRESLMAVMHDAEN